MRYDRCEIHQQSAYHYCNNCFVCHIFESFYNKAGQIDITHDQCHKQHIIEQLINRGYTISRGNPTGHLITIYIEPPHVKLTVKHS